MDAAEPVSAWVLEADEPARLRHARNLVRTQAEVVREVGLGGDVLCLEAKGADPRLAARLNRVLGHPAERRMDCDVARFPLGRGWVAVVLEPPALDLEPALDALGLTFRQVSVSSELGVPATVCTPRAAIADADALRLDLIELGQVVRAVYEVGGCARY
ncbi:MAG: hypothetical protein H6738_21510 [Alphaproteobacteria bacterium]|nr:hypothetical protein [Alphaproteobacteria bacterium]